MEGASGAPVAMFKSSLSRVYRNYILLTNGEYFSIFVNLLLAGGLGNLYFTHYECAKI